MNDYEAKLEARRERLLRAAEAAERKSSEAFQRSRDILDPIPFGQPILVGHHSEKRHRNALRKADNAMRRSVEYAARAKELRARAEGVGRGGISAEDEDATAKLAQKLEALERRRERMKLVNKAHKMHLKGKPIDGLGLTDDERRAVETYEPAYSSEPHPFPPYALQNLGARIRDTKKRLETMRAEEAAKGNGNGEDREIWGNGFRVYEDSAENRVCIELDERLPRDQFKAIRSLGFVWSRANSRFQRKLVTTGAGNMWDNGWGEEWAKRIATIIS